MISFLVACALGAPWAPAQDQKRVSSITGEVVRHEAFASRTLGNRRNVAVYLPPGYRSQPSQRYPVFYLGDGQNVFDGMTSFIPNMEWRADEAAEALIRARAIEPLILVAVDNGGMARGDEYLPTRAAPNDRSPQYGGKADVFAKFVAEELKPFIDRTYRTRRDPANTAIGGSSFGGIMALHLALSRPDVFGKAAVVSPSVWWDDKVMVRRVKALGKRPNVRIWLDTGTDEGVNAERDAAELHKALLGKGWADGRNLLFYLDKGAKHNEEAWAKRFGMILMFLFPRR